MRKSNPHLVETGRGQDFPAPPQIDLEELGRKFSKQYLALFYATGEVKYVRKHIPAELQDELFSKLRLLAHAGNLSEIGHNPGNNLKSMKGKYAGKYSIRLNRDYRILFCWGKAEGAIDVTLIHRGSL